MARLYCLLIGCLFGHFQTAYILGRIKGIDIRNYGSGNAGTTNTVRTLGTKDGLIVLAGDLLKSILAVVVIWLLYGKTHPENIYLLKLYGAAGCILGHNYPVYLRFHGGKGVAASAGSLMALHPWFIPGIAVSFLVPYLVTSYVSLGSLVMMGVSFIQMLVMGETGVFGTSRPVLTEMYILMAMITGLCYVQHKGNIGRLLKGRERKTYLDKRNKALLDKNNE